MMKKVTNIPAKNSRYLLAIIPGTHERSFGPIGINGAKVYTICFGETAAVVSDAPNGRIRPERKNFAAHQTVLKTLVENGDLLPMSFGNISTNGSAVKDFLAEEQIFDRKSPEASFRKNRNGAESESRCPQYFSNTWSGLMRNFA